MREATIEVLKALCEGKEVTEVKGIEFKTTRVSNEIVYIRNTLNIQVNTVRVNLENRKWYGRYELVRDKDNLAKAKEVLQRLQNESGRSN